MTIVMKLHFKIFCNKFWWLQTTSNAGCAESISANSSLCSEPVWISGTVLPGLKCFVLPTAYLHTPFPIHSHHLTLLMETFSTTTHCCKPKWNPNILCGLPLKPEMLCNLACLLWAHRLLFSKECDYVLCIFRVII
jgi:hypothetical protein